MDRCIFCKIAEGDIPCAALTESERVISFLDINPVNHGHALVVPKAHVESLTDALSQDLQESVLIVQKVARVCVEVTGAEGFNVLQNNGRCSGQEVPHLHFHVIPRWPDDGFSLGWRQGRYEGAEMEDLRCQIAGKLRQV